MDADGLFEGCRNGGAGTTGEFVDGECVYLKSRLCFLLLSLFNRYLVSRAAEREALEVSLLVTIKDESGNERMGIDSPSYHPSSHEIYALRRLNRSFSHIDASSTNACEFRASTRNSVAEARPHIRSHQAGGEGGNKRSPMRANSQGK